MARTRRSAWSRTSILTRLPDPHLSLPTFPFSGMVWRQAVHRVDQTALGPTLRKGNKKKDLIILAGNQERAGGDEGA